MKKILILSVLGLSLGAMNSYAQGSIAFNTYNAQNSAGIITTYGAGGNIGAGLDSTFTGVLLWSSVAINEAATTGPVADGATLNPLWNVGSTALFNTGAAAGVPGLGYITGPNLNITAAVGTTLYFEIAAYNGSSYGSGTFAGHSASFTGTLAVTPATPDANQLNNMSPFQVYNVVAVPEPSTLALAGLGGFGMLMALRRKKA